MWSKEATNAQSYTNSDHPRPQNFNIKSSTSMQIYDIDQHGYSQAYLHHVHSPDEQVGVAHRAAAHAAVDLYEAGASRGVLELHVKHTL